MYTERKKSIAVVTVTLAACIVMAVIDGYISPPYALKSAAKIVLFGGMPILYAIIFGDTELKSVFKPTKNGLLLSLGLGFAVYAVIVGGYFLFRDIFDFSAVTESLVSGEGVTKDNFIYVAVYGNSAVAGDNYTIQVFSFIGCQKARKICNVFGLTPTS